MYEGDFAAFARPWEQATSTSPSSCGTGRTDEPAGPGPNLYADSSGFKLMELNLGSALGGMENADTAGRCSSTRRWWTSREAHSLGYIDTMREHIHDLLTESGFAPGSFPVVAVTDWPSSYASRLGPYFRLLADRWRELGLDAYACHIGQLETRNGRVWLDGRKVDIIARMFMIEYLLESPTAPELFAPILDASARWRGEDSSPRSTRICSPARAGWRCCPTIATGTCSPGPSSLASTGSCRGHGKSGPGRCRWPMARRPTCSTMRSPTSRSWCSSPTCCTAARAWS